MKAQMEMAAPPPPKGGSPDTQSLSKPSSHLSDGHFPPSGGGGALYPDANLTLRFAYGQIKGYDPQDAVHFDYQTTLDGVVGKYTAGSPEFDVPSKLRELYNRKDYGPYGV